MNLFKKRAINDYKILVLVRLLDASKKFLIFLVLFAQVWSLVPWNALQVNASTVTEQEIVSSDNVKYPTTTDSDFDPSLVEIESEMVNEREASSKTFRKVDGTYEVALYGDVIHYQDNSEWKQIDNSLNDLGDDLENKANQFKVKFPKKLDESKQIKLSMDGYNIDWNLLGIGTSNISYDNTEILPSNMKELIHINQSILYSNIQPNVDLEYILTGSKVKENIILNQYVENFSLTFEYKLKDLSLIEDESGNIAFTNLDNEIIFFFSDLNMLDTDANESMDIACDLIEKGDKTYQITIIPSDAWLQTAIYPVLIDPTIINNYQTANISDTYVSETNKTVKYYGSSILRISNTLSSSEYRGILNFIIPSSIMGEEIVNTTLTLTSSVKATGRIIGLYKNQSFIDTGAINWDNMPLYSTDMTDYHIVGSDNQYIFNITEAVKEWQSTGNPQTTGFTIKDKYDYGAYNSVCSLETGSDTSKPVIEFTYVKSSGMKDYWTYSSQDVGNAGVGYVSDFTGKLIFIKNELSYSTDKQSFGLSLIYNIDRKNVDIGYGLGWQTNYSMTYGQIVLNEEYAVTDGTGNTVHYYHTTCDTRFVNDQYNLYRCYLAEDGSGNIFFTNYYGSYPIEIAVLTMQQIRYKFSNNHLFQITDTKTGLDINITRNSVDLNKIESITDETGNKIELTYLNGRLDYSYLKIKQPDNSLEILEYIRHYYTLISAYAKYALWYSTKYADYDKDTAPTVSPSNYCIYDSYARITSVYEVSGLKTAYTYDSINPSSDKIWTIKQYSNISYLFSEIDYSYDFKSTTMIDQNLNYVTYKFDNYGHTVNVLDNHGNAQSFSFRNIFSITDENYSTLLLDGELNYNYNNKLVSMSDPYKTIENVVLNHSFEYAFPYDLSWQLDQPYYDFQDELSNSYCELSVYGVCSGQLYVPDTNHYGSFNQIVNLDYGNYILSGYVKNETIGSNVSISVSGDVQENTSVLVPNDGEWHYVTVLVDVDFNNTPITIELNNNGVGNAYFDNIQLTEGFRDTRQNVLDNPSFEVLDIYGNIGGWWGFDSSEIFRTQTNGITSDIEEKVLGDYAIQISGDAKELRYAYSIFGDYFTGDFADGILSIGGWAYSNSTPISMQSTDTYPEVFRIKVDVLSVIYSYGSAEYYAHLVSTNYIEFDTSIEGWQYKLEEIPFDANNFIYIVLEYEGEGYVMFDQLQMYYEGIYSKYEYDIQGRMVSVQSPSGVVTYYEYGNANDSRATKVISGSSEIDLEINDSDALVESVTYNNVKCDPTYNSYGQMTSNVVGEGNDFFTTSTTYLSTAFSQYVSSNTNEFGDVTHYYTDTLTGLLEAIVNANGDDLLYIYDDEGKLIKAIHVDSFTSYEVGDPYYSIVEYQYDSEDRLDKIILERDSNGDAIYYYDLDYDTIDRIYQVRVNSQLLMTYTYKMNGTYYTNRLSTQTYGNGDVIEFSYDEEDQISSVDFNGFTKFSYEYNQSGLIAVYNEHDVLGNISKSEYYTYDFSGRLKQMVDSDNNRVEYTYDFEGNLTALEFSINDVDQSVNYHNNKCLLWNSEDGTICDAPSALYDRTTYSSQDGYNISKENFYETTALLRLNQIKLILNTNITLITETINFSGSTIRISSIIYNLLSDTVVYKYAYSYDDIGNITFYGYFENTVLKNSYTYQYDELSQLVVEDVRDTQYTVNELEDTNYTKYYYYDSKGNITDIKTFLYGQTDYIEPVIPNEYNDNYGNNPIFVVVSGNTEIAVNGTLTLSFSYYELNYSMPPDPVSLPMLTLIDYSQVDTSTPGYYLLDCIGKDKVGGLTYYLEFGVLITVGTPSGGDKIPETHIQYNYSSTWKDQLTSYGEIDYINGVPQTEVTTQVYSYDAQGNPTTITNFYYDGVKYDHADLVYDGRELSSITVYGLGSSVPVVVITYEYNNQGYRTSKTIDTITQGSQVIEYFLQGDKVVYETDGIYGIIYIYDNDGTLISFNFDSNVGDTTDGIEYYYIRNQQGDITKIIDHNGDIVVTYEYDAWGNIINWNEISSIDIVHINPYTYRGYRYDEETSLYYLNSRYYDANIGRFINADGALGTIGNSQTTNMFAYTANNPIMNIDNNGYSWKSFWIGVENWWNTVPTNSISDDNSNLWGIIGNTGFGLGLSGISSRFDFYGVSTYWYGGNFGRAASIATTFISAIITVAALAITYENIFTSDDGNTNGERLIKCGVETVIALITIGSTYWFGTVATASLVATSAIFTFPVILAAVAVIAIVVLLDVGSEWLYDELRIE